MVRYKEIEELAEEKFRRLTEVKKATFGQMVKILDEEDKRKKTRGGRKSKPCVEYRLLMALKYIREYRTYFHIGQSYGVSENNCFKIIKWVEEILTRHPDLALLGKKEVLKGNVECEILVTDGPETPIDRPKKSRKVLFMKEKEAYNKDTSCCSNGKQENYMHFLC